MADARWALAGGLLGAAAGVLVFAPALWLGTLLDATSGSRLQLGQPRGTFWSGNARLILAGGEGSRDALVLPGRISWQLRPGWGSLNLQLRAECCTPEPMVLTARVRWGGWSLALADNTSHWPAAVLAGLGSPWNTLQARGRLALGARGLSLEWLEGRASVLGSASLEALDLSSRLSTLRPIGSYRLSLIGNGLSDPPQLRLQTLEGSLKISGSGQWNGARWNFRGEASASAEHAPVLGNLLNIVGRRQGATSVIELD